MLYRHLLRPWLFGMDPERVHRQMVALGAHVGRNTIALQLLKAVYAPPQDGVLQQTLWGETLMHPIGLAAGFDKGVALVPLMAALGFGFEEVGSLSANPWAGNPQPRLFRLPADEAIINRMGLNNPGISTLQPVLKQLPSGFPVGISLVKTPDPAIIGQAALQDYGEGLRGIYGLGTYVSLNISCPNTEEGKTFEEPDALDGLLAHLRQVEAECQWQQPGVSSRPWLLKLSPDVADSQLEELVELAVKYGVAGWVATNTTGQRPSTLKTSPARLKAIGRGGLSGPPLFPRSLALVSALYRLHQDRQAPATLVGVGGIHNVETAWAMITHGASLIQLYTSLVYEGPGLIRTLHAGLRRKLAENGFSKIADAVGSALRS